MHEPFAGAVIGPFTVLSPNRSWYVEGLLPAFGTALPRGAGLTLACGSGACAALVTARLRGLAGDAATLILDGGELLVSWPGEGPVTMTGPASLVATGELAPELLDG